MDAAGVWILTRKIQVPKKVEARQVSRSIEFFDGASRYRGEISLGNAGVQGLGVSIALPARVSLLDIRRLPPRLLHPRYLLSMALLLK
jgi:hypothetical protein